MTLAPGTKLGPYEILSPLGAGGMGEVWKAKDTRLDRFVAVKVLPEHLAKHPESLARFEREAKAVAALNHPNILGIHDVGHESNTTYLVMELLEGESLRGRIGRGPMPWREAVDLAIQLALGLAAAHDKGLIHRDLKPENLWLSQDGHLKILDFGLATQARALGQDSESFLPTQAMAPGQGYATQDGQILGTMGYMSPEQVRGQRVDHRSDLFSFGTVLFELLSGQRAFTGESAADTLSAILHEEPRNYKELNLPSDLKAVLHKLLEKDAARRYASANEVVQALQGLVQPAKARPPRLSPRLRNTLLAVGALILLLGGWFLQHQRRIWYAKEVLLPKADRIMFEATGPKDTRAAYSVLEEAERSIPHDSHLAEVWAKVAAFGSFESEPSGATVSIRPFDDPNAPWRTLGQTPVTGVRLPGGLHVTRFEKPGYEPVLASFWFSRPYFLNQERKPDVLRRVLDRVGTLPPGMVRVTGQKDLPDYFVDATEVTNKAYKAFVDAGGYRTKDFWKELLASRDGAKGWPAVVAAFVDETGQPGPATWQAGDSQAGRDQYPVSGISWYEAAAYATWAGKSLPTSRHWEAAYEPDLVPAKMQTSMSNFQGGGPDPVVSHPSLSPFGVSDMAGNVREWCWNEAPGGRVLRGGAWNDAPYMAEEVSQAVPLDRSPKNGFRCVKLMDQAQVVSNLFAPIRPDMERPDFRKIRPPSDTVFRVYREQFSYDKVDLKAKVEWRDASNRDWVQEKATFQAAYDGDRMIAYLFLPTKGGPPYQTVVYFPGSNSTSMRSSKDLDKYLEFDRFLIPYLKSGRAVVYPIYLGTFERGKDDPEWGSSAPTHQYTETAIKLVKDFRRTLDYLETRPELDHDRTAYFGFSWGGIYGAIIPAVEDRIQASLLVVGGLDAKARPEVQQISYVSRVKVPTLMLNGRYDFRFPYETSSRPMFDLLGTPRDKKKQVIYETDHFVPRNEIVKETLAWLDKYLGPVR